MKCRSIIIGIFFVFSLQAGDSLAAYIAKFDPALATSLYENYLETQGESSDLYYSLAKLYSQQGLTRPADSCYLRIIHLEKGSTASYRSYLEFLYDNEAYQKVRSIVHEKRFTEDWGQILLARSYFREGVFDSSLYLGMRLSHLDDGKLMRLSHQGMELKLRSPAWGGIMSAVIPGSGKVYAGRLFDGLQAFSVVAAPAYNAYYHFRKNGVSSVRGWIWTALASWFYLSDIYGSVKAVNEYNEQLKYKIIEKLEP